MVVVVTTTMLVVVVMMMMMTMMMKMIFHDKSGTGETGSRWLRTKSLMKSTWRKWPPPASGWRKRWNAGLDVKPEQLGTDPEKKAHTFLRIWDCQLTFPASKTCDHSSFAKCHPPFFLSFFLMFTMDGDCRASAEERSDKNWSKSTGVL